MDVSTEKIANQHVVYQLRLAEAKATAKRTGTATVGFAIATVAGNKTAKMTAKFLRECNRLTELIKKNRG